MRRIGILGGMFNPVHNGHLRIAIECLENFTFDEVKMLPCAVPPHRASPKVSSVVRLDMLKLAADDIDGVFVDERELARAGPSYTVDTLQSLKQDMSQASFFLILGTDAFQSFDTWHEWEKILSMSNIIIVQRPDFQKGIVSIIEKRLEECFTKNMDEFLACSAGKIFRFHVNQLEISSSNIREILKNKKSAQYLMPEVVLDFIKNNRLYR